MERGALWATVHVVTKSWTWLTTLSWCCLLGQQIDRFTYRPGWCAHRTLWNESFSQVSRVRLCPGKEVMCTWCAAQQRRGLFELSSLSPHLLPVEVPQDSALGPQYLFLSLSCLPGSRDLSPPQRLVCDRYTSPKPKSQVHSFSPRISMPTSSWPHFSHLYHQSSAWAAPNPSLILDIFPPPPSSVRP